MADQGPFSLREATRHDTGAIRRLVLEGGINPTGLKWPRFVVMENGDGAVIACGQLKPHFDGSVELASIAVAAPYRGRGLARRIIEHLVRQHAGALYLMCQVELGPFYNKFGFRPLGADEMPAYFSRIKRMAGMVENIIRKDMLLVMGRAVPGEEPG